MEAMNKEEKQEAVATTEAAHKAALQSTEREKERVVEEAMRMVEDQRALQAQLQAERTKAKAAEQAEKEHERALQATEEERREALAAMGPSTRRRRWRRWSLRRLPTRLR